MKAHPVCFHFSNINKVTMPANNTNPTPPSRTMSHISNPIPFNLPMRVVDLPLPRGTCDWKNLHITISSLTIPNRFWKIKIHAILIYTI